MPMNSKTQRSRNRKLFILPETVGGTPVYPASTDAFLAVELSDFSQETQTAEINEYTDQLLLKQEQVVGFGYANPKMTLHPRFGATAGADPVEGILLQNFFGKKTVNAGTDVTYTWEDHDDTLCAWHQITDVMQQVAAGMVVSEMNVTVSKQELLSYEFTMQSNRILHNSQCELGATQPAATTGLGSTLILDAVASYLCQPGARFDVYDGTSGTFIETITVTSYGANDNEIVADVVNAVNPGDVLKPTLPAGTYSSQKPFAPTEASIYLGPANEPRATLMVPGMKFLTREMSISMNKNINTPTEDELNGSLYGGAEYEIDSPTIELSTTLNLRPKTARLFETAKKDQLRSLAMEIPFGTRKIIVYVPEVFMVVSDGGENAGAIQQQVDFRISAGTATNDAGRFEWIVA